MKRIVSISIGSSKRDHQSTIQINDETYIIERIGTNGSLSKATELIKSLDGKVDAIGMGGIDLYLWGGKKRYVIRDANKLKNAAKITPIVDGSGLKNTLERRVIVYLQQEKIIDFKDKKVLFTSAMDRFGMANSIIECGGDLIVGDLMFGLGINMPLRSLEQLNLLSKFLAPIICQLPFRWLYPTGEKQNKTKKSKLEYYYEKVDIIAGDFHYIKRYMPQTLDNKIIITNTLTKDDLIDLKEGGASLVVTTTPELQGRSFGTNVMEALLVAIINNSGKVANPTLYTKIIDELKLAPRIIPLQKEGPVKNMVNEH
ncbi:hypothetical protein [Alkaliphilus transvaalensis]|uniref:hypothetical protein n=1 Tax=Alkaliphilus transvaalensis TaxID=114628 RepID=UPI00047C5B50|nr:hypothetical protein [Alkaliphilus transvaalensis]